MLGFVLSVIVMFSSAALCLMVILADQWKNV